VGSLLNPSQSRSCFPDVVLDRPLFAVSISAFVNVTARGRFGGREVTCLIGSDKTVKCRYSYLAHRQQSVTREVLPVQVGCMYMLSSNFHAPTPHVVELVGAAASAVSTLRQHYVGKASRGSVG